MQADGTGLFQMLVCLGIGLEKTIPGRAADAPVDVRALFAGKGNVVKVTEKFLYNQLLLILQMGELKAKMFRVGGPVKGQVVGDRLRNLLTAGGGSRNSSVTAH